MPRDSTSSVPPAGPAVSDSTPSCQWGDPESTHVAAISAHGVEVEAIAGLEPSVRHDELGRLGEYRVLKVLGSGGMGAVLLAEDPSLERLVALKVLRKEAAAAANARQRFLHEARATARINHDHIVTIHRVVDGPGVPYIVMELLEGESLEQRLRRGAPPNPFEIWRVGREIALGLAAAHAHGVVHRDIKPANVWLSGPRGKVKILDFGLARPTNGCSQMTHDGYIVGTPAYMSPEQARGKAVDHRCDLFSLGAVLYRMCAGRPPFDAPDVLATLTALVADNPVPPRELNPQIPRALSNFVLHLLAKDPDARPPSAEAALANLSGMLRRPSAPTVVARPEATPTVSAEPEPFPGNPFPGPRRRPESEERAFLKAISGPPPAMRPGAGRANWRMLAAAAAALAVIGIAAPYALPRPAGPAREPAGKARKAAEPESAGGRPPLPAPR